MFVIVLILLAALLYYFGINRILGLPAGPPPLPLIGNMLSFQWDLDKVLLEWKARYGRVFTVWLPYPMVVIGDHKILQEHVVRDGNNFIDRKIPKQMLDLWFGGPYGLGFQKNSIVKETRKFALKTFHEIGFNSATVEDIVHNNALEIISRWRNSEGAALNVSENFEKAIGNVVWRITFGIDLDFENDLLPKYKKITHQFIPVMAGPLMMFV
ncbi:hypothetical protein PRIPAC_97880 [Pristionchus pacificus]|uniref:Cytochrome P450 n=1 Tax=Pristionchus pacificus TaxID=54126 RepID=A0A2A6BIK9_PRIPA|nr:hypothetical protein PRIPAC_97880 [Pristionchus pacificus]|eukprot:PDM65744.1 cytochrome P450 [Pristionchus pacificus]